MAWYWIVLIVLGSIFALTLLVYWFNLENRLIYYKIRPMLNRHYDEIKRDGKI